MDEWTWKWVSGKHTQYCTTGCSNYKVRTTCFTHSTMTIKPANWCENNWNKQARDRGWGWGWGRGAWIAQKGNWLINLPCQLRLKSSAGGVVGVGWCWWWSKSPLLYYFLALSNSIVGGWQGMANQFSAFAGPPSHHHRHRHHHHQRWAWWVGGWR